MTPKSRSNFWCCGCIRQSGPRLKSLPAAFQHCYNLLQVVASRSLSSLLVGIPRREYGRPDQKPPHLDRYRGKLNVTGLWAQYRDELWSDPFLVLALSAALVALATTPLVFAVLGRLEWFKARRGRIMQRPEFSSIVAGMMLVMAIPAIFAALVIKSRSFDRNRYEFDPNRTWSVLDQGREYKNLKTADAAVKQEMERLALERKNLVENVKKLDEAMLALRSVAGTSPAVAQRFPHVLQTLAGVRKSVGVDGPQQLLDYTAPPVDLRAMAAAGLGNNPGLVVAPTLTTGPAATPPALTAAASTGTGLSPAEIEAELATVPEPQRKIAAMLPLVNLPPEWTVGKSGDRHLESFNADNLYEKIDGRAESFIQYGVKGMAYAFYHPTGDPSNELQLYIFEMADPLKALGKYGSEKPDEFKTVPIGNEGYTTAGSTLFYSGRYYTQIVSTQDDPKFGAFALELAKRVAASQKPGGAAAPAVSSPGTPTAVVTTAATPPSTGTPAPAPSPATPSGPAAEIKPVRSRGHPSDVLRFPAGRGPARRPQVRCPGCLRLQLSIRRVHGRLQGRERCLARVPPPLPRRSGGQIGTGEVHRRRQERRCGS